MNRAFVVAMLRRELRASRRRLVLYGSCMALGVAALVGLHGLRATTGSAIDAQSARLLGGDLRLSRRAPFPDDVRERVAALLTTRDAGSAELTRFGSMVSAPSSGRSRLVDVQAADLDYPLRGSVATDPPDAWPRVHEGEAPRAIVDPSLLLQLGIEVGDDVVLGASRFQVVGLVSRAPGSFGMQTQIAPRVLIARGAVEDTGLVTPGSLVEYLLFVRAPTDAVERWAEDNEAALEDQHTRIQTVAGQEEDLQRGVGLMTRFLGLVGLAALALGGVGVAAGVRVLVRDKLDSTAMLRSVGASSRDILWIYGLLALVLGLVSGLIGSALGVGLQWGLPSLLEGLMPVDVAARFEVSAVVTGILLGLWVTLLFAVGPLIDLVRVPPLRSLRADFAAEPLPLRGRVLVAVLIGGSLILVSVWQAPTALVGLGFAAGLGAVLALLAAAARLLATTLRRFAPRRSPYWVRQGLANLFRPRNHTVSSVLTVGFGLFLVATLHGVQGNLLHQLALDSGPNRPNLILFDVQSDQIAPLESFLAERGAAILDRAPLVSARLSGVGGEAVSARIARNPENREARWALLREYRLTYAAELRDTETIAEGAWWDDAEAGASEPVPVSLEDGIAEALDVRVGDAVTWDIQGVPVESVVANVREVDWGQMTTNFVAVFPPGLIEQAPSTSVFLARHADADARAVIQRDLVRDFPNVSVLDASLLLQAIDAMVARIAIAVRVLALFAVGTGFAILVAAAAMARGERTRELLLLRTLGASSAVLRRILLTEAVALGALAAILGTGLSLFATWALTAFLFQIPFAPPLADYALLAVASFGVSALLGGVVGRPTSAGSPLAVLRAQ